MLFHFTYLCFHLKMQLKMRAHRSSNYWNTSFASFKGSKPLCLQLCWLCLIHIYMSDLATSYPGFLFESSAQRLIVIYLLAFATMSDLVVFKDKLKKIITNFAILALGREISVLGRGYIAIINLLNINDVIEELKACLL